MSPAQARAEAFFGHREPVPVDRRAEALQRQRQALLSAADRPFVARRLAEIDRQLGGAK